MKVRQILEDMQQVSDVDYTKSASHVVDSSSNELIVKYGIPQATYRISYNERGSVVDVSPHDERATIRNADRLFAAIKGRVL